MATKIGYVNQQPTAQINWAEVGANFTGMLNEEARVREEKKAEIDRATNEQMKVLKDTPMGDSKNINQLAIGYSDDAQKQLLMANSLLKSGQLKPKDYLLMRQNMADGTDQYFSLIQDYQNEYAGKMERLKSNDPNASSQELEVYLMQTVEGFGNFQNSKPVINPTTGEVLVGFTNPITGKIESDPNKLVGIGNLKNRLKGTYDKYNMDTAIANGKESFGKFDTIVRKVGSRKAQGSITTISDPTFRNQASIDEWVKKGWITQADAALITTFDKTEDAWLEGQLSMYNTTSLLTDNLRNIGGQKFDFTFDPNQQNDNTILLKQVDGNVVPDFESAIGKKQRQIAKDGLRTVLRGAIDHTEKMTTVSDFQEVPQYLIERADRAKTLKNDTTMLGKLYYGTPTEIEAARVYFRDLSPNVLDVTRDENGVTVKSKDANGKVTERSIYFKASGNTLSAEEFIKGAAPLLSGQTDVSSALKSGGYEAGRAFNTTKDKFFSGETDYNARVNSGGTQTNNEEAGGTAKYNKQISAKISDYNKKTF
jgi:hypothetical protein